MRKNVLFSSIITAVVGNALLTAAFLKTGGKIFFWYRTENPRDIPLNFYTYKNRSSFKAFYRCGNRKKSAEVKSGEYGG